MTDRPAAAQLMALIGMAAVAAFVFATVKTTERFQPTLASVFDLSWMFGDRVEPSSSFLHSEQASSEDPCDTLNCDDGDDCTSDSCVDGACVSEPIEGCEDECQNDADCDDGDPCTTDECKGPFGCFNWFGPTGCCTTGADCNDNNPCTIDTCNTSDGSCVARLIASCCRGSEYCDDNDECTSDSCVEGSCRHEPTNYCGDECTNDDDCSEGDECTDVFCIQGDCETSPIDSEECNDDGGEDGDTSDQADGGEDGDTSDHNKGGTGDDR